MVSVPEQDAHAPATAEVAEAEPSLEERFPGMGIFSCPHCEQPRTADKCFGCELCDVLDNLENNDGVREN